MISSKNESEIIEFKKDNIERNQIGKRISALSKSANLHEAKKSYLIFGVDDKTQEIVGTNFKPEKEKVGNDLLEF